MFRFLHAADIHLDSPLIGLELSEAQAAEQIRGATRKAFDNLVDLAIREDVAFLLLAGDVYDGDWKDFNTGLFFNQRMARLNEADIPVFMVLGNHDAASQITKSLRLPDNVVTFSARRPETHVLGELDVAIHGQSFASRAVSEDLSRDYPPARGGCFNIGLLHTALSGREGHEPYAPCSVEGLRAKGYDYWALGHVHQREVVCRDPWMVFPGNLQGRHIRETGPKGCTLVTVEGSEVAAVEAVELDVLRWHLCRVDVSGCGTVDRVYEHTQAELARVLGEGDGRPVVVRLELYGSSPVHRTLQAQSDYWAAELRGLAVNLGGAGIWLEGVRFKTREQMDLDALIRSDEALGGLVRSLLDLEVDAGALREIDPEIEAFLNKLPAELRGGRDAFDPLDAAQWQDIRGDVKDLLIARLLASGADR